MWISLIIIAIILLLISAILFLPVHFLFNVGSDRSPSLFLRFLFLKIDVLKFAEKKSSKPKKRSKALAKSVKENQDQDDKKKPLSERITDTIETVKKVIDIIKEFIQRIKIKKLKIYAVTADTDAADAALDYGKLCAVVYPAVSFLQSCIDIDEKGLEISLHCDFDSESPVFSFDTDIVFNLFNVIAIFVKNALK